MQRPGVNRIVVELPGVQDPARAKEILASVATLEYRAVAEEDARGRAFRHRSRLAPSCSTTREGHRPVLLKREIIAGGDNLVDAAATVDEQGSPAVSVTLDGAGAKRMYAFTEKNVGKPMAVLFDRARSSSTTMPRARNSTSTRTSRRHPGSRPSGGIFGKRFQTTGLQSRARRMTWRCCGKAGALAAPVDIVEERTVGPSLGRQHQARLPGGGARLLPGGAVHGVLLPRVGLFAVAALMVNLPLLVAVLHVILDNLNTHKKNELWLKAHPNVQFHFTPTSASWLNQVEVWFSILQGQSLSGTSFTSLKQLQEHIDAYVNAYNDKAEPFVWTKKKVRQRRFKGRRITQL